MRAVLAAADPSVEVLAGRAEEIPADSSSVDVVIAQSAWHWVDESRAIPEVARVLRPRGRLSLVWTGPDRSVDWMRSLWAGGIIFSPEEKADQDSHRKGRRRRQSSISSKAVVGIGSAIKLPFETAPEFGCALAKSTVLMLRRNYHMAKLEGRPSTRSKFLSLYQPRQCFGGIQACINPGAGIAPCTFKG